MPFCLLTTGRRCLSPKAVTTWRMALTRLLWLVGQLHFWLSCFARGPSGGTVALSGKRPTNFESHFSSENPISLLFVTRWTGSSVMAAAISGFIRSVLVFLQRWQRKKTTSVCAVLWRTHQAENKTHLYTDTQIQTHTPLMQFRTPTKKISSISQQNYRTGF